MSLAVQSVVQQMFCGDEIKASVIDIGSEQCRFGFGGQDTPRIRFRSDVGLVNAESGDMRNRKSASSSSGGGSSSSNCTSSSSSSSSTRKSGSVGMDVDEEGSVRYICGDQRLRYLRPDIDMRQPFKHSDRATDADGNNIVDINWDAVEALLNFGTHDMMSIDPTEYPMLFAENDFTSTADKTKLFELCFESMEAPAVWIANNAVLSAFSSGKPTAMVIDFGASGTRVTPVVDGYALHKAQLKTRRGGDQLSVSACILSVLFIQYRCAVHFKRTSNDPIPTLPYPILYFYCICFHSFIFSFLI
jgi:actin-like protein 6A